MAEFMNSPLAQTIGWALLQSLWQGALVGAVTAAALALVRGNTANVRYVIACLGLLLMAVLPVITTFWSQPDLQNGSFTVPAPAVVVSGIEPAVAAAPVSSPSRTWSFSRSDVEVWLPVLVVLWLVGIGVFSLRMLIGWVQIERIRHHGTRPALAESACAGRLASQLRIKRPVALLASMLVEVPTVVGWLRPVILLPVSALSGLSPVQIEAIVAHELAHIRRHDYFINMLQSIFETLLFYHPLTWWISSRIRAEREHCCDDMAVAFCGDRIAYAEALADLEHLRRSGAVLAVQATGGPLLARIRRLLGVPAPRDQRSLLSAVTLAITVLLLFTLTGGDEVLGSKAQSPAIPFEPASQIELPRVPAEIAASTSRAISAWREQVPPEAPEPPEPPAPPSPPAPPEALQPGALFELPFLQPPEPPAPPAPPSPPFAQENVRNEFRSTSRSSAFGVFNRGHDIRYRGTITLSPDDRDVAQISPGGYMVVKVEGWLGTDREIELRGRPDGTMERRFVLDGRERPFDPEGNAFLAEILPTLIRRFGLAADTRTARILKSNGVDGVLSEVSNLETDYVRRLYLTALFNQANLAGNDLARTLEQASRMSSSYELTQFLILTGGRAVADDRARLPYFQAAGSIQSDYEKRRALTSVIQGSPLPARLELLRTARSIRSDYELATLLIEMANAQPWDPALARPYAEAIDTIQSDYEQRRTLTELAKRASDPATLEAMFQSVSIHLESDYEAAEFLKSMAGPQLNAARQSFFRAVDTIGSSFERRRVLSAVAEVPNASTETLVALLRSAADITSDYEKASVLVLVADRHGLQGQVREAYVETANRIRSNYEQSRAFAALGRSERK